MNSAFISMAIGAGLTSAITNPMVAELMQAVRGADVMMNHDPQCSNWISAYREPVAEGSRGTRRRRRSVKT
jgi:5-methyltetrahydrofolate--homocysteine methyltransferase